ncbi:MAG: NTP transferase domain-containing protein [Rhabdochlamydiaceae bacterium]|nr:NTP transferase domain-containing protein [Rhabdochlamydiaceae bacterium]
MGSRNKKETTCVDKVACIILAGGQGTRLFPLTQNRCKPAVSFGSRYRLIDIPLSHALNAQIPHIYVISQYLATSLHQHILESYQLDLIHNARLILLSPEETAHQKVWYQGTADAVRQNLEHIEACSAEYFLILSGDQLYNMDLHKLLLYGLERDDDLVIASLPVEEKEAKRMGLLEIDGKNHVIDFLEKPQDPHLLKPFAVPLEMLHNYPQKNPKVPHYLGSMGIYLFKREALFSLLKKQGNDFGKDLIPAQIQLGKTSAFIYPGYWEDIGTIDSYYHANLALTQRKECLNTYDEAHPIFTRPHNLPSPLVTDTVIHDSIISQGAVIEAQEITKSIIGIRAHIKKGTIIRNSIVLGNHYSAAQNRPSHLHIGENCLIEKAILDEHCSIGNNVQLTNKNQLKTYDGDGIYIRDGIIIVTTGTRVPDHFSL